MYKTVTHNIVEEHYANPEMTSSSGLPMYTMNEDTMMFRMDSRSLWAKFAWGLLNYGISMSANLPEKERVEARVSKNAQALGDFITPYYGMSAGVRLSGLLSAIGQVGIDVVKATKEGEKLEKLKLMWVDQIDSLAKFLVDLNPGNWPETLTKDYFSNLVTFWVDEITARAAKNGIADEIAIDNINKLIVLGVRNSVPTHKTSSWSDIFSRGIVAQYPTLFS